MFKIAYCGAIQNHNW